MTSAVRHSRASLALWATLLAFAPPPARAADDGGTFYDYGSLPCQEFTHDRLQPGPSPKMMATRLYISGWLSAYNAYMPDTYDILGGRKMDAIVEWLAGYCEANRRETMQSGLIALTGALHPHRLTRYAPEALQP